MINIFTQVALNCATLNTLKTTAVAVGTITAASLAYLYTKKVDEPIPTKWKKVGEIIDLNCFPVKSCAPVKRRLLECHNLGVKYEGLFDRGFIISRSTKQATARSYPNMVLIQPKVEGNKLILSAPERSDFVLDLDELKKKPAYSKVECWYSKVIGIDAGDQAADWLSEFIVGKPGVFRLVFYPHSYPTKGVSQKDRIYKAYRDEDAGSYHDKTSFMLINQGSIDHLNSQLDHVVKPLQFRPNLVVKGPGAYDEDNWKWVRVGENVTFRVLKPCTRCIFTNINPETGLRNIDREPFETLVKTRSIIPDATPVMGIQMGLHIAGNISIGDAIYISDENDE